MRWLSQNIKLFLCEIIVAVVSEDNLGLSHADLNFFHGDLFALVIHGVKLEFARLAISKEINRVTTLLVKLLASLGVGLSATDHLEAGSVSQLPRDDISTFFVQTQNLHRKRAKFDEKTKILCKISTKK